MTLVLTKEKFLKMFSSMKDKDLCIVESTPLNISGQTKKKNKSISFQFTSPDTFDKPDTITDLMESKCFCVVVCKKKILSKGVRKLLKEDRK